MIQGEPFFSSALSGAVRTSGYYAVTSNAYNMGNVGGMKPQNIFGKDDAE